MPMAEPAAEPGSLTAFERQTRGLRFTKDFNSSLDAVMRDELSTAAQRVLAWAKRRAWGNFSLHCKGEDGKPAYQADCAQELGIDKTTVSKTITYYEQRGYIRTEGRLIYPVLEPQPTTPPPEKVGDSPNFSEFLKLWKVANSPNFQALEEARSTVKKAAKSCPLRLQKVADIRNNSGSTLI